MRRAVTAIYRTYDVAALVRDELERLGIGRGHIHVIPDAERRSTSARAGTVGAPGTVVATPGTGTTPGSDFTTTTPRYADTAAAYTDAAPAYSDADAPYADAFDDLHDLHLPESDTRVYQQAIRNGDYVVSVDLDDNADIARVQEIMRRPEDAYDLNDLDTRYGDATYAPRRQALREDYSNGMMGRRDDARSTPYSRYYDRDTPLWPRGGV